MTEEADAQEARSPFAVTEPLGSEGVLFFELLDTRLQSAVYEFYGDSLDLPPVNSPRYQPHQMEVANRNRRVIHSRQCNERGRGWGASFTYRIG